MKNLFVFIVSVLAVFLSSYTETNVFNVSLEVTPMEVKNGEEITVSIVKNEDTNVDFKAEIFWEDMKISEISKAPYELKYVVSGVEEGFYKIGSVISYKSQSGLMSSSNTSRMSKTIYVTE